MRCTEKNSGGLTPAGTGLRSGRGHGQRLGWGFASEPRPQNEEAPEAGDGRRLAQVSLTSLGGISSQAHGPQFTGPRCSRQDARHRLEGQAGQSGFPSLPPFGGTYGRPLLFPHALGWNQWAILAEAGELRTNWIFKLKRES